MALTRAWLDAIAPSEVTCPPLLPSCTDQSTSVSVDPVTLAISNVLPPAATWIFCGNAVTVTSGREKYFHRYHPAPPSTPSSTKATIHILPAPPPGVSKGCTRVAGEYWSAVGVDVDVGAGAVAAADLTGVPQAR